MHVGSCEAVQGETNGIGTCSGRAGVAGGIASNFCLAPEFQMEIFFTSAVLVAIAEIGDKTMLLAILLATRFRAPFPIIAGIFVATLANHLLAALVGQQVAGLLNAPWFRWVIALGFIAMAGWTLVPDKIDGDEAEVSHKGSIFLTTAIAFFIVEMGDKTQVATVALGAQYHSAFAVAAGTTFGMMVANVPAVFLGEGLVKCVSLNVIRMIAASLFFALGSWQVWELVR